MALLQATCVLHGAPEGCQAAVQLVGTLFPAATKVEWHKQLMIGHAGAAGQREAAARQSWLEHCDSQRARAG